jgi:hypothetical protein
MVSDIHLSDTAPLFRSDEPNWHEAMLRPLMQLSSIAEYVDAPIICAGDVFDKWNSTPALINFAISAMPEMHAVVGQHDMPYHSIEQIQSSCYWTAVLAGTIHHIQEPYVIQTSKGVMLGIQGFGWGEEITSPAKNLKADVKLAVVHKFCWSHKWNGIPGHTKGRVEWFSKRLQGFDAAVIGDNHHPFLEHLHYAATIIYNHGAFMRRSLNELEIQPEIGLLCHRDNRTWVERVLLDVSLDRILSTEDQVTEVESSIKDFMEVASTLFVADSSEEDVRREVRNYVEAHKIRPGVADIVLHALEHAMDRH